MREGSTLANQPGLGLKQCAQAGLIAIDDGFYGPGKRRCAHGYTFTAGRNGVKAPAG
jgi:hypothetical protein